MKNWLIGAVIGVLAATFTLDADAQRRLGGGRNIGRQSAPVQQQQAPAAQPQAVPPSTQTAQPKAAQPGAQPGAAAPAKPASPWRGALMGLAAGLGLAALASWLGFGETLTMLLMAALIALVVFAVIGFVSRRMRGPQPAYQASGYQAARREPVSLPVERPAVTGGGARPGSAMDEFTRAAGQATSSNGTPWGVPANFDTKGFLDSAKRCFNRLQTAWDRGDLAELQEFSTQDMFVALTHELRERGGSTQTEQITVDATLLGIEAGGADQLASVRFNGSMRVNGASERVDEVWNFSKAADGKSGWLLAGIQQLS